MMAFVYVDKVKITETNLNGKLSNALWPGMYIFISIKIDKLSQIFKYANIHNHSDRARAWPWS